MVNYNVFNIVHHAAKEFEPAAIIATGSGIQWKIMYYYAHGSSTTFTQPSSFLLKIS